MSRVSLAYPSDGLCYAFSRDRTRRMPLGLAYIAAALERAGHVVSVTDGMLDGLSSEDVAKSAVRFDPEFIGIGCTTPVYHQAVEIADYVKRMSPKTVVIMGGPHVSALPVATLETSNADFVCIGEAEESIIRIIECVLENGNPSEIPGIAYNWNGFMGVGVQYRRKISQSSSEYVKAIDINRVPIPSRHLFDTVRYGDLARGVFQPQASAAFTRGCPGKCAFCGASGTMVRMRNLDNVLDELQQIQNLGIGAVFVMDDTYTNNKNRVIELSRRIVKSNIRLDISVQLRLDQIDRQVCDAMYESGVRYVGPGIESGNEDIIKAIGKGPKESKEHMRAKVKILNEYDWTVRCSYVMGMVNETESQIMETIEFAKELDADENAFSILTPYPDSPLWSIAKDRGLVHDKMDFSKFLYYHKIGCNLSSVSTERLMELHEYAYAYVGSRSYKTKDESVGSGNRQFIPNPR